MITVKYKKRDYITNINISGHAMYDDYGKDIVCASVSSVAINTINVLSIIDFSIINVDKSDGYINIIVNKYNDLVNKILLNLIDELKELTIKYKKNIRVEEESHE